MLGEALQVLLLLATIIINRIDPLLQFANNGVDLVIEATLTSPIEVFFLSFFNLKTDFNLI